MTHTTLSWHSSPGIVVWHSGSVVVTVDVVVFVLEVVVAVEVFVVVVFVACVLVVVVNVDVLVVEEVMVTVVVAIHGKSESQLMVLLHVSSSHNGEVHGSPLAVLLKPRSLWLPSTSPLLNTEHDAPSLASKSTGWCHISQRLAVSVNVTAVQLFPKALRQSVRQISSSTSLTTSSLTLADLCEPPLATTHAVLSSLRIEPVGTRAAQVLPSWSSK